MHDEGRSFKFGAAERRLTAVHEAGHAVAYSLAGFCLERVEIADEGVPFAQLDHWGICKPCGGGVYIVGLKWNGDAGAFDTDRDAHLAHIRRLERPLARRLRRHMRASACVRLAGQLAEQRAYGRAAPVSLEGVAAGDDWPGHFDQVLQEREYEIEEAQAICSLLPSRRAYEHALRATARALLDHWQFVERVASELERLGRLEGHALATLLPPARRHWPPAQVSR